MFIEFDKDYLRELYEQGRTSDKKHRYQPEVIRGFQKAVFLLSSANTVSDLFRNNALNYEVLQGDKKGISSMRHTSCGRPSRYILGKYSKTSWRRAAYRNESSPPLSASLIPCLTR